MGSISVIRNPQDNILSKLNPFCNTLVTGIYIESHLVMIMWRVTSSALVKNKLQVIERMTGIPRTEHASYDEVSRKC